MFKGLSNKVDDHEVYEYIYSRKRFNTDLIMYAIIASILVVFRATCYLLYGIDGFRGTPYDILSLIFLSGVVGSAIKSVSTLKRSRAIGKVDHRTGEIEVVTDLEDPRPLD